MPVEPFLLIGLGFVIGLFASLFVRISLSGQETERLVNQKALELVQKALHKYDPICKFDSPIDTEETESDASKEND